MDEFELNENQTSRGMRLIFGYLCVFLAFVGGITLLPLLIIPFFPGEWICFPAFLIPGGSALILGTVLGFLLTKGRQKGKLAKFQDSVLLVFIWLTTVLVGALPFFLADKVAFFGGNDGALSMSFSESVFESVSGYCAVGFTVLHGFTGAGEPVFSSFLDASQGYCSHVFLLYRAITQFFGGVGLVLVVASAVSDRFGMQLFATEGHNDRLLPNLAKTAKATFGIYMIIIALGTISMWLFGMDWFESLCHSIAGMATGGFSTRISGFYQYSNPNPILGFVSPVGIEITIMIVMILGATSFLLIWNALTMKWKNVIKDAELRFMGFVILLFTILGLFLVMYQFDGGKGQDFATSLRYSVFQMISCVTTTGFGNAPSVIILGQGVVALSIILMIIGGGVGSTAGAIKQLRVVIALKYLWWSILHKFSPSRFRYPHYFMRAGKPVEVTDDLYKENVNYIILYLVVLMVPTIILVFLPKGGDGSYFNATESLYLVSSSLSGTGNTIVDFLGLRISVFNNGGNAMWSYYLVLWIMSVCMFLGRLEILPVYYALRRISTLVLKRQAI